MLGNLPVSADPRVLVDYRTSDDAGVYRLDEHRALVQTVDFFTPVVDDPVAYGRIAGANALSDIYAMGARPLTALAIAGFPKDGDRTVLSDILRGGLQALTEAGVALMGGHTVQDQEIKFGYAVTGEVDPARMWTNSGAKPGDHLILTKPIGTGVVATAIKFGRADEGVAARAIATMVELNRTAAEALLALPDGSIHGCTDITGFGLVGHASEMALASGCVLEIDVESVPLLDGALDLVDRNTPGGGRTNHGHFSARVDASRHGSDTRRIQLLYDPQTSGGLLASISPEAYEAAMAGLRAAGVTAQSVGRVVERASSSGSTGSTANLAVILR